MLRLLVDKPMRDSAFKKSSEPLASSYFTVDFMEAGRCAERTFNAAGGIARGGNLVDFLQNPAFIEKKLLERY